MSCFEKFCMKIVRAQNGPFSASITEPLGASCYPLAEKVSLKGRDASSEMFGEAASSTFLLTSQQNQQLSLPDFSNVNLTRRTVLLTHLRCCSARISCERAHLVLPLFPVLFVTLTGKRVTRLVAMTHCHLRAFVIPAC